MEEKAWDASLDPVNALPGGDDPTFQLTYQSDAGFTVTFGGGGDLNVSSLSLLDSSSNTLSFNIGGISLTGVWNVGLPPGIEPASDTIITAPSANAIVITGHRDTTTSYDASVTSGFLDFNPVLNGFNFNDGYGGAGSAPYETAGTSAAANRFASQHVTNGGETPADEHAYKMFHDDLAKLYDFAKMNPFELVDVGDSLWISAASAIMELDHAQIHITDDSPELNHGSWTQASPDYRSATITFNPQNSDPQGLYYWISNYADIGENWAMFHELGHALNDLSGNPPGTEGTADSAARSLMNLLEIPTPPLSGLQFDD